MAGVIKRCALDAGLPLARYAGHSLRAGFASAAAEAEADVSEMAIVAQTRSLPMLRRYVRDADLFGDNAGARVGLYEVRSRQRRRDEARWWVLYPCG